MIRRCAFFCLVLSAGLSAQTTPTQPAGIQAEWDVRAQMTALATDIRKLQPLLGHVDTKAWVEKGAPDAYLKQLQSAKASIQTLIAATDALSQDPEKLPVALEAFFQMERMELLMTSLRDGIRKYQSSELADLFNHEFSTDAVHRDRLRQHIKDLANQRQQEFQIASEEAQRCRGLLTKQTTPEQERRSPRSRSQQAPPPAKQ